MGLHKALTQTATFHTTSGWSLTHLHVVSVLVPSGSAVTTRNFGSVGSVDRLAVNKWGSFHRWFPSFVDLPFFVSAPYRSDFFCFVEPVLRGATAGFKFALDAPLKFSCEQRRTVGERLHKLLDGELLFRRALVALLQICGVERAV